MSQRKKKKGEKLLSGSVMTTEHNKSAPPTHRQRSSSRRGGRQGPWSPFPGLRGSLPWLFQNRVQQRRCPGGRQVPLIWRFSAGVILPPWGYLAMSGAIFFFFCHNWAAATGFFGVAVRDTAKHPAMHRAAPTTQKYPAPNLSGAEVEKCCPTSASEQHLYMRYRYMFFFFFF